MRRYSNPQRSWCSSIVLILCATACSTTPSLGETALSGQTTAEPPRYCITEVARTLSRDMPNPRKLVAINEHGDVVGTGYVSDTRGLEAFKLPAGGAVTALGAVSDKETQAVDVNGAGVATGISHSLLGYDGRHKVTRWTGTDVQELSIETPDSDGSGHGDIENSRASAINDKGVIVGQQGTEYSPWDLRPFVHENGQSTRLRVLLQNGETAYTANANDVNDTGVVVGNIFPSTGSPNILDDLNRQRAVVWTNKFATGLYLAEGARADAINAFGAIVGSREYYSGTFQSNVTGFVVRPMPSNGSIIWNLVDLPGAEVREGGSYDKTQPLAINGYGDIVGAAGSQVSDPFKNSQKKAAALREFGLEDKHAAIWLARQEADASWTPGAAGYVLDDYIDACPGSNTQGTPTLIQAYDINSRGQIVAMGTYEDNPSQEYIFLLTPRTSAPNRSPRVEIITNEADGKITAFFQNGSTTVKTRIAAQGRATINWEIVETDPATSAAVPTPTFVGDTTQSSVAIQFYGAGRYKLRIRISDGIHRSDTFVWVESRYGIFAPGICRGCSE